MKKKRKPNQRLATEHTVARRFKMHPATVKLIRSYAPAYGSQGRALQVATEIITRLDPTIPEQFFAISESAKLTAMSYKLLPRTADIIDELATQHNVSRGRVLAFCAAILDPAIRLMTYVAE